MKKAIFLITAVVICGLTSWSQPESGKDQDQIKKVIQAAYIDGLQNRTNLDAIEEGFHPGFSLLIYKGNMMDKLPIYNWAQYAKMKKEKNPDGPTEEEKVSCTFENIDITGTAAVAKIKFFIGKKHVYTDYLSLYKFDDGWKIVSKIYYKIPEEGETKK